MNLLKANNSQKQPNVLDLNLSISRRFVTTVIYDERDDFDCNIVNFPFLDGDDTHATFYVVYISQLVRFCGAKYNKRILCITEKLLKQCYRYYKLRKTV